MLKLALGYSPHKCIDVANASVSLQMHIKCECTLEGNSSLIRGLQILVKANYELGHAFIYCKTCIKFIDL